MASSTAGGHFLLLVLFLLSSAAYGQLLTNFYTDCPSLDTIVSGRVNSTLSNNPRMGASLLRLFFHDCFVQGCDASVLLDDVVFMNGTIMLSEKSVGPNANSLRGFELIDQIKGEVQKKCRKVVVSCADILALAARAAVVVVRAIYM